MRRAVVNIRRTGDDGFKWAVLSGMHPIDANGDRSYEQVYRTY